MAATMWEIAPRWIPLCTAHELRRDFREVVIHAEPAKSAAELRELWEELGDFPFDALWTRGRPAHHEATIARLASTFGSVRGALLIARTALQEVAAEMTAADPLAPSLRRLAAGDALRSSDHLVIVFDDRRWPCLGWIGEWGEVVRLRDRLARLAAETLPVLVLGESGTGKELVARGLHALGRRRDRPFLAINCAELPESVLESELFGHTHGSFTGATADRPGLFEAAADGTVFLDEIGELPLPAQAKLLRVLEEHRVRRVGSTQPRPLACRVVAATNRALGEEVSQGRFRADLFYRLRGSEIALPPLRERRDDLLPLAELFVARAALRFRSRGARLTDDARLALCGHDWPGNIRELRQTIEVAVLGSPDAPIDAQQLGLGSRCVRTEPQSEPLLSVKALERAHILRALVSTAGNKMAAARILGLTRQSLERRIARHGIALAPGNGRLQESGTPANGYAAPVGGQFSKQAGR